MREIWRAKTEIVPQNIEFNVDVAMHICKTEEEEEEKDPPINGKNMAFDPLVKENRRRTSSGNPVLLASDPRRLSFAIPPSMVRKISDKKIAFNVNPHSKISVLGRENLSPVFESDEVAAVYKQEFAYSKF